MTRCEHCGKPADGQYELVFERDPVSREVELSLCAHYLGMFEERAEVGPAESD